MIHFVVDTIKKNKRLLWALFVIFTLLEANIYSAAAPRPTKSLEKELAEQKTVETPKTVAPTFKTPTIQKPEIEVSKTDVSKAEAPIVKPPVARKPVKSLERELEELTREVRGGAEVDEYVQIEAHLQVDAVKKAMNRIELWSVDDNGKAVKSNKTPNQIIAPYLGLIASMINKEVELSDKYYVVYHGTSNLWRVPQDIFKQLYAYYNPLKSVKDFIFLRFSKIVTTTVTEYLREKIKEFGGIYDPKLKSDMISVNFSPFGNVGISGECTWNYFMTGKSHVWPFPANYEEILKYFNLKYSKKEQKNKDSGELETSDVLLPSGLSLYQEAGKLSDMLNVTEEQTLLQIFIPKNIVDDIGWVSTYLGFPLHEESVEWLEKRIKGKTKVGKVTGAAVRRLMKKYQDKNDPMYKDLVASISSGDFGISGYLNVYRNTPWTLDNANEAQGRLLLRADIFLNPNSGLKFFNYNVIPPKVEEEYQKQLNILVQKIIDSQKAPTK